ncbi:hypothetical protein ABZT49_32125 [Methylobacterium sp. EM32]
MQGVHPGSLGLAYGEYSDTGREAVVSVYRRTPVFEEDVIQACSVIRASR